MASAHDLARGHKRLRGLIEFALGEGWKVVRSRTGTVCTATARAERPWPRGSAGLPGETAFNPGRFLSSYPQGIAGTRSLPGIGFGSVMRRTVAARRGPIPWG